MNAKIKGLILGGSLIVLGLVIAFNPAFGQFYQYTDKNGNTVFTDKPPVGSGPGKAPEGRWNLPLESGGRRLSCL